MNITFQHANSVEIVSVSTTVGARFPDDERREIAKFISKERLSDTSQVVRPGVRIMMLLPGERFYKLIANYRKVFAFLDNLPSPSLAEARAIDAMMRDFPGNPQGLLGLRDELVGRIE